MTTGQRTIAEVVLPVSLLVIGVSSLVWWLWMQLARSSWSQPKVVCLLQFGDCATVPGE